VSAKRPVKKPLGDEGMSNAAQLEPMTDPGNEVTQTPPRPPIKSPLMTLIEGAHYLRISRSSLYRQIRLGNIPWRNVPGSKARLLHRDDLDKLIDDARTQRDELSAADSASHTDDA
jgi:excisionase family DNA binding protein